jgi:glyoxylase-like metal-dependent hydrolase (beta-lactamase superfamily II)
MNKALPLAALAAAVSLAAIDASGADAAAELSLTRLDCAPSTFNGPADIGRFSDTFAYEGQKQALTASCYLIKHGSDYMIWDTGYPVSAPQGPTVKTPLVDQLAKLNLKASDIKYVGISHYHGDHTGQASAFPDAMLLIGKGDWDALTSTQPSQMVNPAPLAHWIKEGGKSEPVPKDKDVFGDGSVMMLDLPGHTPGHHGLLVRLKNKGNVLLSGDVAHLRENYENNGVPTFNTDRSQSLASLDRFHKIATNLKATVIIQHDPRDIDKLPAFPAAAN